MRASVVRVLACTLVLALATGSVAWAQDGLLGKRRSESSSAISIRGKYRSNGRIRVVADGGDFGRLADVSRAALGGLADLTRAQGKPRFALTKDRCWLPLAHGASCTLEAVMLDADQPAPPHTDPRKVFTVADVPAVP